ncbi:hypothetical protein FRC03_009046 [Tulasnella sp. 419]|nr:hypothetical protein FRC02_007805 [Tulasnella sp. 418]KAG8958511.1 hypothetical protein FRC03_009046 [Tulasnella sp. 419]
MATSIKIFVSSPDTFSERHYDLHLTVGQLKTKLESVTGIPPDSQILTLYRDRDDTDAIRELDDDSKALGYYSLVDWMLIKVTDKNPANSLAGQFTDVSQVDKFEISKEEYEQRRDTVLQYKKAHKMGRFADQPAGDKPMTPSPTATQSHHINVGSRCEVIVGEDGGLKKRGTVRFVGTTKFGKGGGEWVGVEYDEPVGKNDGSVQGERYFTCPPNRGAFVRADKVTIGDFPEEEIDEIEEM